MRVSVIMSEYATDPTIFSKSIESILMQTFEDFELVIVDDSGSGRLAGLLHKFDDVRIRTVDNKGNKGLAYSLNVAIAEAKGEYLLRMDTDDIALPERIERQYDFMESHPEYSVVGSRAVEFTGNREQGVLGTAGEKTAKSVMRGDTMVHPSVMMRTADIVDAGGYAEYHRAEDLALWLELLMRGRRLFVMDEILLKYRVNLEDYAKRTLRNRRGEIKVRLHYYPKLGAGPIEYVRVIRTVVAGLLPAALVRWYRKQFVLKTVDTTKGTDV